MSEKDFFDMSSKQGMVMGFLGGLAIFSAIGFLISVGGGEIGSAKTANNNINTNPTAVAPTPTPAAAPTPTGVTPTVGAGDHIKGNPDAKITLIEFSDVQCPFCQRFHPTAQRLIDEYPDDVRWVYKHFPLDSIHPEARPGAEAAECVAAQLGDEGFFDFIDVMFAKQSSLSRTQYITEAVNLGANEATFTACLDNGDGKSKVEADYQQGVAGGVRGTPSSFINGQNVSGAVPFEQFKTIVDGLL